MSRYPFTDCIKGYLPVERGHIAANTMETTSRRLYQLGRIFHAMKEEKLVSTDNPRTLTALDINAFVGYRREHGIGDATVLKDLGLLDKLLSYYDNDAVRLFSVKFPSHKPRKYQHRLPSLEEPVVQKILDRAAELDAGNWRLMEPYGLVCIAICTGFRPKELRMLDVRNVHVSGDTAEILAVHVKGEGRYGAARWVSVHPDGVTILKKYLEARKTRLDAAHKQEQALFPPLIHKGGYVSYHAVQVMKARVEADIGETFELRKCRRTFGQRALNEGQEIYNVSLVMGHASLATTQRYYCNKEQRAACDDMQDFWDRKRREGS